MKNAISTNMIYCRLKQLIAEKEFREKRKITYKVIQDETGLSSTTIAKLLNFRGIQRIDGTTLDKLCEFFGCQVGDILTHIPNDFVDMVDPHNRTEEIEALVEGYDVKPVSKDKFIITPKSKDSLPT